MNLLFVDQPMLDGTPLIQLDQPDLLITAVFPLRSGLGELGLGDEGKGDLSLGFSDLESGGRA